MSDIKELENKISNLKKSIDAKQAKISTASIGGEDDSEDFYKEYIAELYRYVNMLDEYNRQRIGDLWNRIYEHEQGHLPKIQTPSQMQNAVDALGLGSDYEVQKRTIYASRENKWTFNATLKK